MSMKFILSRTNDYEVHSKKWIVGYGLLFWLISRVVSMLLIIVCVAVYNTCGINPETLTKFAGDPETAKNLGSITYTEIQSSEEMLQENPVDSIQAYDETNTQDDTSNSEDTSADYEEEEYTEEDSFGNFDDEDEDSFF